MTLSSEKKDKQKEVESCLDGRLLIVKPAIFTRKPVPLFCPVCKYAMRSIEDGIAFRSLGVCAQCDNRWTTDRRIDWNNQEKLPAVVDVEAWEEYLEVRRITSRPIFTLK